MKMNCIPKTDTLVIFIGGKIGLRIPEGVRKYIHEIVDRRSRIHISVLGVI